MILESFGVLEKGALALVNGAVDSTNVIQMTNIDYTALSDVWLVIDTHTAAGGHADSTYTFNLVMSEEATLDTNVSVLSLTITALTDARIATAGNRILEVNLGNTLQNIDNSTYPYLGLIITLADNSGTATLKINAAISPSKPQSKFNAQVIRSNVELPS